MQGGGGGKTAGRGGRVVCGGSDRRDQCYEGRELLLLCAAWTLPAGDVFSAVFSAVYQSIVHTQELLADGKKKKAVDKNYVPDFKAAIANPNAAMEQVLALKSTKSVKARFDHSYDQRSSSRTQPW